jgi:predicted ATP-grasp superfamily ATP-dependent carboligase
VAPAASLPRAPTIVLAGLSVRALAASARRGGWRVIGLDVFGDVDTRACCDAWRPIGASDALEIDVQRLERALREVAPGSDGWVAGSGFEDRPEALALGAGTLPLLGNDAAAVRRVRDPGIFFGTLRRLSLRHPDVSSALPRDAPGDWLAKCAGGAGGVHVVPAREVVAACRPVPADTYFQRRVDGVPVSALFVADGRRARLVGLNRQFVRGTGERPYTWAGAIGPLVDPALARTLAEAIDALVPAFGLRGLASLDAVVDAAGRAWLLEVNPRPTATVALHDDAWPEGLLRVHVDAVRGRLPDTPPRHAPGRVQATRVIFAPSDARIDAAQSATWARTGCLHDVPGPDTLLSAGDPVCTVSAAGGDAAAVLRELGAREDAVLQALERLETSARRVPPRDRSDPFDLFDLEPADLFPPSTWLTWPALRLEGARPTGVV